MATLTTTRRHGERGQAIIELALTLPLLLLVVLGVFDFGLMFQRFEVVTNAAREGARVAVLARLHARTRREAHAKNYLAAGGIIRHALRTPRMCPGRSPGTVCVRRPRTTTIPQWRQRRPRPST